MKDNPLLEPPEHLWLRVLASLVHSKSVNCRALSDAIIFCTGQTTPLDMFDEMEGWRTRVAGIPICELGLVYRTAYAEDAITSYRGRYDISSTRQLVNRLAKALKPEYAEILLREYAVRQLQEHL